MTPLRTIAQTGCKIVGTSTSNFMDWFHVMHLARDDSLIAAANFAKLRDEVEAHGESWETPATPCGVVLVIPPDAGEEIKEKLRLMVFMADRHNHVLCEETYAAVRLRAEQAHWRNLTLYQRLLICRRADLPPRQAVTSESVPDRARRILNARPAPIAALPPA